MSKNSGEGRMRRIAMDKLDAAVRKKHYEAKRLMLLALEKQKAIFSSNVTQ